MKWISYRKTRKMYRQVLKIVKGLSGLERAEKIFDTLIKQDLCNYTRWNYEQEMMNRSSNNAFAVTIMQNMIAIIDENERFYTDCKMD